MAVPFIYVPVFKDIMFYLSQKLHNALLASVTVSPDTYLS